MHAGELGSIVDDGQARMTALLEIHFHEEDDGEALLNRYERPSSLSARISSSMRYWTLYVFARDAQRPVQRNVASAFEAPRPPPSLPIFPEITHDMRLHQSRFAEVQ